MAHPPLYIINLATNYRNNSKIISSKRSGPILHRMSPQRTNFSIRQFLEYFNSFCCFNPTLKDVKIGNIKSTKIVKKFDWFSWWIYLYLPYTHQGFNHLLMQVAKEFHFYLVKQSNIYLAYIGTKNFKFLLCLSFRKKKMSIFIENERAHWVKLNFLAFDMISICVP